MTTDFTADLTSDEQAQLAEMLTALHERGYGDVAEHGGLRAGARIRHRGHQWSGAYTSGTGVVLAVTEKPDSAWSVSWHMPDVELLALWDRDHGSGRLSMLAQYHVDVVGGAQ
jgi:hypothetical protein